MAVKVEGIIWLVTVFIRFLWTIYPQTGYIHPDEFFQSPEFIAGDVLGFQTLRTWEFRESFPIRSVLLPALCTGIPFKVLQKLHSLAILTWNVNSWELLVASRIAFCCLSLLVDLSLYKISSILKVDPAPMLGVVGTSYVMLVFNTRPFSNSTESVLFALLLWILANHLLSLESTVCQARLRNLGIGVVVVAGVWNRPTFLAYAFIPVLSWCYKFYKDTRITVTSILMFVKESFFVAAGAIFTAIIFVTADSVYFGHFTVTPFNFIKYNLDTSHLKEHGLHPRYTHLLVNMPLMFGVLAILYYAGIINMVYTRKLKVPLHLRNTDNKESSNTKSKEKTTSYDSNLLFYNVLVLSVIVPIIILSMIPHQEARFLTPILTPLAILFGHVIFGPKQSSLATASWFIWNITGCIMFGVLHQGGMYSCLHYLQSHLSTASSNNLNTTYHVVFSNTYMPPRYLLAWPVCVEGSKCPVMTNKLRVHDLGGQTNGELTSWLEHLIQQEKMNNASYEIFLVCPSTIYFKHHQFFKVKEFIPHLTLEHPPNLGSFFDFNNQCKSKLGSSETCLFGDESWINWEFLSSWFQSNMSLNLYRYSPENEHL